MLAAALLLLAHHSVSAAAQAPPQQTSLPTRFDDVTWDNENWVLHASSPDPGHYQSRASLSNGYIGISLASLGPFYEVDVPVAGDNINGWPLFDRRQSFSTIAGFYDVQNATNGTNFEWLLQLGGESVISGIPHWSGLHLAYGDDVLDATTDLAQISGFHSALDMKRAVLFWDYTWTPPGGPALQVAYTTFIHRLYVNQAAVQLNVTSSQPATVRVLDLLEGDGALRTQAPKTGCDDTNTIWSSVQPHWIPYVTAYIYSTITTAGGYGRQVLNEAALTGGNASSIAQDITFDLKPGQVLSVDKFLGIASTDAFDDPQTTASNAAQQGPSQGFARMMDSHVQDWQTQFVEEKVDNFALPNGSLPNDPNLVDAQILAVTNPFSLLSNTVSPTAIQKANNDKLNVHSIAVCGLQSECYAGLIFWDVEVWMQPGLVVSFPEAAQQVANYRALTYQQAKDNIKTKFITSQANTTFSPDAAIYPWTSGRFGNCTGTGPCFDYEYHLNGDINLELEHYLVASGDVATFKDKYFPIYDSLAQVYANLLAYNSSASAYMLHNATDPDEYANHVDNPGYTMALMKTEIDSANAYRQSYGMPAIALNTSQIYVPVDNSADLILEYSGMNGSIQVKQADVVLIDDFLAYPNPYTLPDLDFYAGHQSLDGPGMTYGVFADVASNHVPAGCSAYTYFLYSAQPYLRAPWYQFSEQTSDNYTANGGTHPAFPFLTGAGGNHRVPVFGFLGLRLAADALHIAPSLPPQIPRLAYRTIYWQGHPVHAVSNASHTTLTRGPANASLATADPAYAGTAPIPVVLSSSSSPNTTSYNLTSASPLTVPNARPDLTLATPNNLAQCRPASANATNLPGQIPLAATDGAVSTAWQPSLANTTSTLTVDLGAAGNALVHGFTLDWAHQPPVSFSIAFANDTGPGAPTRFAAAQTSVAVSSPYVPARAADVVPYTSNTTTVSLGTPVWGGRFVLLSVAGNQDSDEEGAAGASVAEIAVLTALPSPSSVAARAMHGLSSAAGRIHATIDRWAGFAEL